MCTHNAVVERFRWFVSIAMWSALVFLYLLMPGVPDISVEQFGFVAMLKKISLVALLVSFPSAVMCMWADI